MSAPRPLRALVLALLVALGAAATPVKARAQASDRDAALVETYRKMLAEDPGQQYALRRLLEVSHAVGGLAGLVAAYEEAVAKQPKDFAAWMVLGHLRRAGDEVPEALAAYERAAAIRPKDAGPHLATAALHRRGQQWAKALAAYDRAVALPLDKASRQEALQAAADTALEAKDVARANGYFDALVKTEPGNLFLRMEHAAALGRAGEHEAALAIWREVRKRAGGDLKHLVIVWKEIADVEERMGQLDAAEATLREALERTPDGHWARGGFLDGLIGLYRRQDRLRELIAEWEPGIGRSRALLLTVARLYEEVADDARALALYEQAIAKQPSDGPTRLKAIALLERVGKPEQVVEAYRALIRAMPGEPRHELRLAELLFHQGRARDGFELLARLSKRHASDPGVHQAVIDLTIRYGDKEHRARIEAEYKILMRLEPNEEAHVVSLGEYYWTQNDKARALATWKRLTAMGRSPGEGWFLLAEVYGEHDMTAEAAQAFEQALEREPDNDRFAKAYALMLEREKQFTKAQALWRRVLDRGSDGDPPVAREARRHIVGLWEREGRLEAEIERLTARFGATPPDVEAGRFLGSAYLRLRRYEEARRVLERLRALHPDDSETLSGLEIVFTRQNKLHEAIEVLEQLARANPPAAADAMHRAAELALSLGDAPRALDLMRKVVALHPADPGAHLKVGELYVRMGRLGEAAEAWRQALALDPRNQSVRFKLAGLYRELSNLVREEQVLGDIVREASDPSDALRAGRRLLQVATVAQRLEATEELLRPLAATRRDRGVYLKLLVDVYALLAQQIAWSQAPPAERRAELDALGTRGLKVLLDAIGDADVAVRSRALDVLRLARPSGAAPALARLADGADALMQFQAAVALGHVGGAAAAGALARMAAGPHRDNRDAAIWALGLVEAAEARTALHGLVRLPDARVRELVALALGHLASPESAPTLEPMATTESRGEVRRAALWALGRIGAPSSVRTFTAALATGSSEEARLAAWALGRVGTPEAREALAAHLWRGPEEVQAEVGRALLTAARADAPTGPRSEQADAAVAAAYGAFADLGSNRLSRDPTHLVAASREVDAPDGARRLQDLQAVATLVDRRLTVILGSHERAAMLALLGGLSRDAVGAPCLAPLVPEACADARISAWIAGRLEPHAPQLLGLAAGSHGPTLQAAALRALGALATDEQGPFAAAAVEGGIAAALAATAPEVRLGAAQAAADAGRPGATALAAALARASAAPETADDPLLRIALARALGRVGTSGAAGAMIALARDPVATVRQSALAAVGRADGALLGALIDALADPVPDVALEAIAALGRQPDPSARQALERIARSGEPRMRRAAREALAGPSAGRSP